ncbi:tetratricopeptide repeat protein [bacterium]|nr:tetratricopeptide repeat protein [bacterium]
MQTDLWDDFGEVRYNQGRFTEAKALYDRALAMAEKSYPADSPVIAESLLNQAASAYAASQLDAAVAFNQRALSILRPQRANHPEKFIQALSAMASIRLVQGQFEAALTLNNEALNLLRANGSGGELLISTLNTQPMILHNSDRHDDAQRIMQEAVREAERVWGKNSPMLARLLNHLQSILYHQGDEAAAEAAALRALEILQFTYPDGHPEGAAALANVGDFLSETDDVRARAYFDQAISMAKQFDDALAGYSALRSRALMKHRLKDFVGGLSDIESAVALCEQHSPGGSMCYAIRANHANMLVKAGRPQESLEKAQAVVIELERHGLAQSNEYTQALTAKAWAQKALGQLTEAIATQTRAVEIAEKAYGPEHSETKLLRKI